MLPTGSLRVSFHPHHSPLQFRGRGDRSIPQRCAETSPCLGLGGCLERGAGVSPAEGLGVPPQFPILPPRLGARGLKEDHTTAYGCSLDSRLRGSHVRGCRDSSLPGSGVSPDPLLPPKSGGPRGLKEDHTTAYGCFPGFPPPRESREEGAGTRPCRGLGCPQILYCPPRMGARGLKESLETTCPGSVLWVTESQQLQRDRRE
jgi:hypothetical protein